MPLRTRTRVDGVWHGRGGPTGEAFTPGVTKPTALNSGARLSPLATYGSAGNPTTVTISNPGVYERLAVYGTIKVLPLTGVVLRDCRVFMTGTPTTSQYGILFDNENAEGNVVEHTTVSVPNPTERTNEWFSAGIRGRGFEAYRCDVSGTVDGIHAVSKTGATETRKIRLVGNYLHGFDARPSVSQGTTHDDGIQVFGGVELEVIGNTIEGGVTSCIILNYSVSDGYGPVTITDNWLHGYPGAGATINVATSQEPIPGLSILRNRVDRAGNDSGQITIQTPHRVPSSFGALSGTVNGTVSDWVYGPDKNFYMDNSSEVRIQVG